MSQAGKSSPLAAQIDENLRKVYEEVATEELPDRFKQLLAKLKDQTANQSNSTAGDDA